MSKKRNTPKFDRSAVMRRAHELRAGGMDFGDAMRAAWAEARGEKVMAPAGPNAQPAGPRAALRRYGVDMDRLAELSARAVEAVKRVATEAIRRTAAPAALPYHGDAIDARKGSDGVYRF